MKPEIIKLNPEQLHQIAHLQQHKRTMCIVSGGLRNGLVLGYSEDQIGGADLISFFYLPEPYAQQIDDIIRSATKAIEAELPFKLKRFAPGE